MSEDPEPAINISGGPGGGGRVTDFDPSRQSRRVDQIVDRLGEVYWKKAYGGQDAYRCLIRTILSQNTSDKASQPAFDSFIERFADDNDDLPFTVVHADPESITEAIESAGLYNQKTEVIVQVSEWIIDSFGCAEAFDKFVRETSVETVRNRLLSRTGIGPKTADCVLLFSGGRSGVFPVDTHVNRIARRLGIASPSADHEAVRETLERDVSSEKCGFAHTAMIQFGREYCTARKPACLDDPEACPLFDLCDRVGVDPESGDVVDPSDGNSDGDRSEK